MTTESEPMDLSEKSTSLVCAPSLSVAVLDQHHLASAENQLQSPARSMSSSSTSRDDGDVTSAVGGLEPSDVARSQNQV